MLNDVGAAAIYGAVGGGLGALLGVLIASFLRNTKFYQMAAAALAGGGAVLGMNIAQPLLEPYIGEYLPKSASEEEFEKQFEWMIQELQSYSLIAAIMERDPSLKKQLRSDFEKVAKEATTPALARQMGFSAGYNTLSAKITFYLARATNDDLVIFIRTMVENLNDLSERDPRFCYDYLYNPTAMATLSAEETKEKIGLDFFNRQQSEGAVLVRNAFDDVPSYDVAAAEAALQSAAIGFQAMLGDKIGLVSGAILPESDEDAKLACDATSALYTAILSQENPALAGRHIFVAAGG